jgi:HlyD family secretion protein
VTRYDFAAAPRVAAAAVLASSLFAGCSHPSPSTSTGGTVSPTVPVTVLPLRYTKIANPIELSGSLSAVESVTVGAMTGGRVLTVKVRAGDIVHAGDVLAQIDTSGSVAELARARAGASAAAASESASKSTIEAAKASIASAQAQADVARARASLSQTTASRMEKLFAQGAISAQQLDQTRADMAGARAAVAQAQAGLEGARKSYGAAVAQSRAAADTSIGAQAGIAAATVPLRDATLTAPFDGIVVNKFVEPGAVVSPGSPVVAVQNARDLEVDVAVPDDALAGLSAGTPIAVRVDAVGGAPIAGHVRAIVPSQNAALRSATLKIAVPTRVGLQPGMFARVSVPGAVRSGWVAPLAALVTRAGQSGVFVVRDGTASFVPLQTGAVGKSTVEVLGIDGRATQVAVSGLQRVDDGTRVTVTR